MYNAYTYIIKAFLLYFTRMKDENSRQILFSSNFSLKRFILFKPLLSGSGHMVYGCDPLHICDR